MLNSFLGAGGIIKEKGEYRLGKPRATLTRRSWRRVDSNVEGALFHVSIEALGRYLRCRSGNSDLRKSSKRRLEHDTVASTILDDTVRRIRPNADHLRRCSPYRTGHGNPK